MAVAVVLQEWMVNVDVVVAIVDVAAVEAGVVRAVVLPLARAQPGWEGGLDAMAGTEWKTTDAGFADWS